MRPFAYERPGMTSEALAAVAANEKRSTPPQTAAAQFIAGGTNMSDYMRLEVMRPERLIDVNRLSDPEIGQIHVSEEGIRFGALVRMSEAAEHPEIRRRYPVIADSLNLAASPQIRNMASLAGNILQRTRCEYFREVSWPCNKRKPGSGCAAMEGVNRQNAVLGVSDKCIATYHGDFGQALIALDATVDVLGPHGPREIAFADLHRRPGDAPHIETCLASDEMIVAIRVPAGPWTARSLYLKVRDRQSYAFSLASAAVALDLDGDRVREVRIGLGGVATAPWRARPAEDLLYGQRLNEETAARAAEAAFREAQPREHNAFKVPLGRQTLVRALLEAKAMEVEP